MYGWQLGLFFFCSLFIFHSCVNGRPTCPDWKSKDGFSSLSAGASGRSSLDFPSPHFFPARPHVIQTRCVLVLSIFSSRRSSFFLLLLLPRPKRGNRMKSQRKKGQKYSQDRRNESRMWERENATTAAAAAAESLWGNWIDMPAIQIIISIWNEGKRLRAREKRTRWRRRPNRTALCAFRDFLLSSFRILFFSSTPVPFSHYHKKARLDSAL